MIADHVRLDYYEVQMNAPSEAGGILEHLVFEIAQGVSGQTGVPFFRSLVRHLAAALEADFVLVGTLQPGSERIQALAVYGGEADTLEYELAGTPCENVVRNNRAPTPAESSECSLKFPCSRKWARRGMSAFL